MIVDLPEYDIRKDITTSDPAAVMEAFRTDIRFILPRFFGYRMCPSCPQCSESETIKPNARTGRIFKIGQLLDQELKEACQNLD